MLRSLDLTKIVTINVMQHAPYIYEYFRKCVMPASEFEQTSRYIPPFIGSEIKLKQPRLFL